MNKYFVLFNFPKYDYNLKMNYNKIKPRKWNTLITENNQPYFTFIKYINFKLSSQNWKKLILIPIEDLRNIYYYYISIRQNKNHTEISKKVIGGSSKTAMALKLFKMWGISWLHERQHLMVVITS